MCKQSRWAVLVATVLLSFTGTAEGARIKDLARIDGVRFNQLVGYGLVVGLNGTGDSRSVKLAAQSLESMLRALGREPAEEIRARNIAAVMVIAELPPFVSPGDKIDVIVSAIGDAHSLVSGTLVMSALRGGMDAEPYALAQGPLLTSGFDIRAGPLNRRSRNAVTTARIPGGAIVERAVPTRFVTDGKIRLLLRQADFTTALRITTAINESPAGKVAFARNAGAVEVAVPEADRDNPVAFIAAIETLEVEPDTQAIVVIDQRSGTVVVGGDVKLGPASVAHANLDVAISTSFGVSQPSAFSRTGRTVQVPNTDIEALEEKERLKAIPATTTVADLVKALNALGATPRDLAVILEKLYQAGALRAEIRSQ